MSAGFVLAVGVVPRPAIIRRPATGVSSTKPLPVIVWTLVAPASAHPLQPALFSIAPDAPAVVLTRLVHSTGLCACAAGTYPVSNTPANTTTVNTPDPRLTRSSM